MKPRIFITGGSGLLAVNWAVTMRNEFDIILGLHRRKIELTGVRTIEHALLSPGWLQSEIENIKPDIIIHTAGLTSVEDCEKDPALAYATNVSLTENIAKITSSLGIGLVHISTDHLFDGIKPNVIEMDLPEPVNVYGKTKGEAEQKVLENHPRALVIRTNFYGWGPAYRASFSDTILNRLREGKEISLFTDVYFTPILIQTLIKTVHELLDKKQSGIFNVVGDERISKFEFGIKLAHEFDLDTKNILPIHFADKAGLTKRPLDLSLSNKKICTLLGHQLGDIKAQFQQLHDLESDPSINNIRKL